MSKFFITGVSSGIGRALTKKLVINGGIVWGIARRGALLKDLERELNSANFIQTTMNQTESSHWDSLVTSFKRKKFVPQVVIFNAAISQNDLQSGIDIEIMKKIMEVNFFGIMRGIKALLPLVKPKAQFIAISSFSAFKGSGVEGIGYAASKSALSIGFESLYQKYKEKDIVFKTIFFGPINSGMGPFQKNIPFVLSEEQAVNHIVRSITIRQGQFFHPWIIFFLIKFIKLLPSNIYFKILALMELIHSKYKKS